MVDDLSKAALVLLFLTIARGIVYALLIPPWQTPDEPSHFAYVRFISQNHRLPPSERVPVSEEILASMSHFGFWKLRYSALDQFSLAELRKFRVATTHPPLYYLLGTVILIPLSGDDVIRQLYVLRLASVFMGAFTVLVAFRATKTLFPEDSILPLTVGSFIVFLPMHSFVSASVNNDNLAELVASLVVYFLIKVLRDGMSPLRGLGLAILLGAGCFAKRTTFYTIPLVLMSVPIYLWTRTYAITDSWRIAQRWLSGLLSKVRNIGMVAMNRGNLLKGIGIVFFIGFVCGALYVLLVGVQAFDSGFHVRETLTQQFALPLLAKRHDPSLDNHGFSSLSLYLLSGLLTFASFWANFGWMNVPLNPGWYALLAAISLAAFLGLALLGVRKVWSCEEHIVSRERWQKGAFLVLLLASLLICVQTFVPMILRAAPMQGRYLYPAIVPLAILFVLGLREFVPPSYRDGVLPVCILGLFLFDAICLTCYVVPHFYV
jgi:hypothetical protein